MISLPMGLVKRLVNLLHDIVNMKPGYEIYDTANQLVIDLTKELGNR